MAMDRFHTLRLPAACLAALIMTGCQGPTAPVAEAPSPADRTPAATTTSDSAATTAAAAAHASLPPTSPVALDPRLLAVCDQFRARRGAPRIDEGRLVFAHCLPGATTLGRGAAGPVRDFDRPTFDLSRDAMITLLGEPDALNDDAAVYELGERHGRRHVLQVQLADNRVASSSLVVWY